jgi:hypothetical protein
VTSPTKNGGAIRAPQDLAGGLFVALIGLGAYFLAGDLPIGTLRAMGPGMLPKSFGLILAALGLILMLFSTRADGPGLDRWSIRGIFFVLGGTLLFGLAIRGFDIGPVSVPALGLIVAGPLLVLVSGFASDEVKWKELGIFAVCMTAVCGALFKYALGLPIPLAPWLIGV